MCVLYWGINFHGIRFALLHNFIVEMGDLANVGSLCDCIGFA